MRNSTRFVATLSLVLAAVALPAHSATVTLCGPTVCYEYNDDPGVNTGINVFGAPSLLAGSDFLEFTPTTFTVSASNGGSQSLTAVFLFDRIYSATGGEIQFLAVWDSGNYRILGGGQVSDTIQLVVTDVLDNGNSAFPEQVTDTQVFQTGFATGISPVNWWNAAVISPGDAFADLATSVSLQISNTLSATTFSAGQFASIVKSLTVASAAAALQPEVVIPVPAALWLFASAAGLLGLMRRRITTTG